MIGITQQQVRQHHTVQLLRLAFMAAVLMLLAACKSVIPSSGTQTTAPPPVDAPTAALPTDAERHRVALLVPLSGTNAGIGQSIANATSMALLDTQNQTVRITQYDTATGAAAAAQQAIADGNKLILGPLLNDDVVAVAGVAVPAGVPIISYSNDVGVATRDVFILGHVPAQSIARSIAHARAQGINRFSALVPNNVYGQRASASFLTALRDSGATLGSVQTYDRSQTAIAAAARRMREAGNYDAVLIADSGRSAAQIAPVVKAAGSATPRILGTELWTSDAEIANTAALRGAWFSSVSDTRFRQFSESYRSRFNAQPYRLATLGYDSVLLTIRVSRDWRAGTPFPTARLYDRDGFIGLDGVFRFGGNGIAERALEVREIGAATITVANPAPASFGN